eukprot:TRINITY_DN65173_c0_g1_i1.p1 TRINITY_DN65173_c0_g1~~TRINITY_DN65173_c0_g1_i1.p1  ORF type:complete len:406 (-),score=63.20 TRINITY_DN65173_c0_g1_i1:70-1239(-)
MKLTHRQAAVGVVAAIVAASATGWLVSRHRPQSSVQYRSHGELVQRLLDMLKDVDAIRGNERLSERKVAAQTVDNDLRLLELQIDVSTKEGQVQMDLIAHIRAALKEEMEHIDKNTNANLSYTDTELPMLIGLMACGGLGWFLSKRLRLIFSMIQIREWHANAMARKLAAEDDADFNKQRRGKGKRPIAKNQHKDVRRRARPLVSEESQKDDNNVSPSHASSSDRCDDDSYVPTGGCSSPRGVLCRKDTSQTVCSQASTVAPASDGDAESHDGRESPPGILGSFSSDGEDVDVEISEQRVLEETSAVPELDDGCIYACRPGSEVQVLRPLLTQEGQTLFTDGEVVYQMACVPSAQIFGQDDDDSDSDGSEMFDHATLKRSHSEPAFGTL